MDPRLVFKPDISAELAIELANRLYGLTVTSINQMVSYDDKNFHIKVSKDHKNKYIKSICEEGYTLKILNTLRSSQEGHFDTLHGVMLHLDKKGLRVPLPVKNIEGTTWKLENVPILVESEDETKPKGLCGIQLLTYIPGVPVGSLAYTKEILYEWGQLMANFHKSMSDFIEPKLKEKPLFWNLENVPRIVSFLEGLEDERMELVMNVLNRYQTDIDDKIEYVPKGIIHGDFNENNILARLKECSDTDKPIYVVDGILDYDDVHYGAYVWDVGVMIAYTLLECNAMDPIEGAGHVLAGYSKVKTLNELELSMLKMCVLCRLCQSLVMGAYSFRKEPQNSYLLVSAKNGWKRLEYIWRTPNKILLDQWKEIRLKYEEL